MDETSFFLGLHTALAAQALISCLLCLFQKELRNKMLGILVAVLMHNAFRGTVIQPISDAFPALGELLAIPTSQFYLPLLYIYLICHINPLSLQKVLRQLVAPLGLLTFSIAATFFWPYLTDTAQNRLIVVFDGLLELVQVYFFLKGVMLLKNKTVWEGFRKNYVNRLKGLFFYLGLYFSIVGLWNFLRVVDVMSFVPQLDQGISSTQRALFYLILVALPLYCYSSVSRLKQLFPPAKINIAPGHKEKLSKAIDDHFLNEKIHLSSELTTESLYKVLGFEKSEVRLFIEEEYQLSINDFINKNRIDSFKDALSRQEHKTHDIYSVARQCGFKSRSNFYRIFKAFEGVTPTEFIKGQSLS